MSTDDFSNTIGYSEFGSPALVLKPRLRVLWEGGQAPAGGRVKYLDENGEVSVGRTVDADQLLLDDKRASRRHARVRTRLNRMTLTDLSSNGTFVNGKRVTEIGLLENDITRIGDSFLLTRYQPDADEDADIPELLGDAPSMCALRARIGRVAPTDATVLILGESGTGKELVARALHDLSGRSGPFVACNCSAIPETLAESQLFGHERGAFTGALKDNPGYFRAADGGTLFLDEVGELPQILQPKLLRVLEDRNVTPVGSTRTVPVDVRIVAATNADIQQAVDDDRFRGDLYARLAEFSLYPPPLRERREDILTILRSVLPGDAPPLSANLIEALLVYNWPFNVRELRTVAKQLGILGAGKRALRLQMVEKRLGRPRDTGHSSTRPATGTSEPTSGLAPEVTVPTDHSGPTPRPATPSRDDMVALVREHRGNIAHISRALGRSRKQVYRYIDKYEINLDEYR